MEIEPNALPRRGGLGPAASSVVRGDACLERQYPRGFPANVVYIF